MVLVLPGSVDGMTTRTQHQTTLPELGGAPTGRWVIDPAHSSVTFSVRHLMSKVRGRFVDVEGRIEVGPTPAACAVEATVATSSVDTGTAMRDDDLRSERFFDADAHPTLTWASTSVRAHDGRLTVVGDLTLRGVTREVTLDAEFLGLDEHGLQGEPRIGFSAQTRVRRSDFGIGESGVEGNRVVIGDVVDIELDVEAVLDDEDAS